MKTLYWFLWLKKEETKQLVRDYWEPFAGVIVCLAIIYAITFIPYIHANKPLPLRIMVAVIFFMGFIALSAMIVLAVKAIYDFLKDNWNKAKKIKSEIEGIKGEWWCDNCNSKVIIKPNAYGRVEKRCKCKWADQLWRDM